MYVQYTEPHSNWHTDLQVSEDDHESQEAERDVPRRDVVLIIIIMIMIMVVLPAMKAALQIVSIAVFSISKACSQTGRCQGFGGIHCIHLHGTK
jgi:hypothetical protein